MRTQPPPTPSGPPPSRFPLFMVGVLLGGALLGLLWLWVRGPLPPALDVALLRALRNPEDPLRAFGPRWVGDVARDVTALGSNVVAMGLPLVIAGGLWLQRLRAPALFLLVLLSGAQVLVNGLKLLVERDRPSEVPHLAEMFTYSFPSGHATLAACIYPTLAALLATRAPSRALGSYCMGVALLVALLVGASRVLLGVHYPSDVVGGWALGAVWALVAWRIFMAPARGGGAPPARGEDGKAASSSQRRSSRI